MKECIPTLIAYKYVRSKKCNTASLKFITVQHVHKYNTVYRKGEWEISVLAEVIVRDNRVFCNVRQNESLDDNNSIILKHFKNMNSALFRYCCFLLRSNWSVYVQNIQGVSDHP